ncbi:MAG: helix-turn-helix domain-containing protein [Oscillospiraceae bacterium]|nr:helix-turn-helix domain-containing protein [Oscillospiraceae bacterium]MBR6840288.1 helix-turn-helix domain-containing protein [Oscillospiraceae bacterium]
MDHNDSITFSISQVAKMLGVVPGTIRNWEKAGLISVKRSGSNYRLFTVDDLATLRRVKEYSIDKHMGTHAIKLLLGGSGESDFEESIRQQAEKQYSKKLMSEKWRELRKQKGYTLEDVSRSVGISVAHLSKLENGGNVSLELLRDLAHFYGESLLYFLEPVREEKHLVEKSCGDPLDLNGDPGIEMLSLVAMREHVMYPVLCKVKPGSGNMTPHNHNGEEFIHMFSGTLEITLNDGPPYLLHQGDSFYYRGSDLHCWRNPSRRMARFLWIHSSVAK